MPFKNGVKCRDAVMAHATGSSEIWPFFCTFRWTTTATTTDDEESEAPIVHRSRRRRVSIRLAAGVRAAAFLATAPAGDAEIQGTLHVDDTRNDSCGLLDVTGTRVQGGAPVEIGKTGTLIENTLSSAAFLEFLAAAAGARVVAADLCPCGGERQRLLERNRDGILRHRRLRGPRSPQTFAQTFSVSAEHGIVHE